tara:strand:+ start:131 stop:640 length:510 start_codon:yes stop_codon:yes gene_type:complete
MLESLISSKTRIKLLSRFFINLANNTHLRGLANEFNDSTNSIRKELNNLYKAGYLLKSKDANKINYSANSKHPLFSTLQKIVRNHLGLEQLINSIIEKIGTVNEIILVGDYAKGIDSGNIEVIINGKGINSKYLNEIAYKIEKKINRKVTVYLNKEINKFPILKIFSNE